MTYTPYGLANAGDKGIMPQEDTMPAASSGTSSSVATTSTPSELDELFSGVAGNGNIISNNRVHIPIPMPVPHQPAQMMIPPVGATKNETQRNSAYALAANISSMVQNHQQEHEAKQLRNLQFDLERLMVAMQNPDIPENKQVIDDILSDPKRRKQIEKAFDIDLFGGKSSKESGALQGALGKYNARQGQAAPQPQATTVPTPQGGGQPMSEQLPGGQPNPNNAVPANSVAGNNPAAAAIQRRLGMPVAPGLSPRMQAIQELIKNDVIPGATEKIKAQVEQMKEDYGIKKEDIISARSLKVATIQALGREQAAQVSGQARVVAANIVASAGIAKENLRFQNKITELVARGMVLRQMDAKGNVTLSPGPNANNAAAAKITDTRRQLLKDQVDTAKQVIAMADKELEDREAQRPGFWLTSQNDREAWDKANIEPIKKLKRAAEASIANATENQQKLLKGMDKGGGKAGTVNMTDPGSPDDLLNDYDVNDDSDDESN